MKMKQKKTTPKNKRIFIPNKWHAVLCGFLVVVFAAGAVFGLMRGLDHTSEESLYWEETEKSVNYKVYLQDNIYFEEKYLTEESGKAAISSLIDYIELTFNYGLGLSDEVEGSYDYEIVGVMSASKEASTKGEYWEKEYVLDSGSALAYQSNLGYSFSRSVKVNYDYYNSLMSSFKSEYGLSASGNLKVMMRVKSHNVYAIFEAPVEVTGEISVDIPLSEKPIDISIPAGDNTKNSDTAVETEDIFGVKHLSLIALGGLCAVAACASLAICIFEAIGCRRMLGEYAVELRKIMKGYDGILCTIDALPDLKGLKIIEVGSFEELVDAHSEVRRPINLYVNERKKIAWFILISEGLAWEFILRDEK